ncbi:hypothetical protein ACHAXN_009487 [Cyclotella atomus]
MTTHYYLTTGIHLQIDHGSSLTNTSTPSTTFHSTNQNRPLTISTRHHLMAPARKSKNTAPGRSRPKYFSTKASRHHISTRSYALLDHQSSVALMTMSQIDETHRIKNHTFHTALQCKLRLPIINNTTDFKCKCGAMLNPYGDHCLGCKVNHKSKSSNGIRDEIIKIF